MTYETEVFSHTGRFFDVYGTFQCMCIISGKHGCHCDDLD